jgi:hypothetical protein
VVQTIVLASLLADGGALPPIAGLSRPAAGPLRPLSAPVSASARVAVGLCAGAPGLVGAVRVSLDP